MSGSAVLYSSELYQTALFIQDRSLYVLRCSIAALAMAYDDVCVRFVFSFHMMIVIRGLDSNTQQGKKVMPPVYLVALNIFLP